MDTREELKMLTQNGKKKDELITMVKNYVTTKYNIWFYLS
jgi:hypothetical protein